MKESDIQFGSDFSMPLRIPQQVEPILLQISDATTTRHQILRLEFRESLANFINMSARWYADLRARLKSEAPQSNEVVLLQIHILSEQDAELVLGLEFWVDFDLEHGRGFKINARTLDVFECGPGEVAFL